MYAAEASSAPSPRAKYPRATIRGSPSLPASFQARRTRSEKGATRSADPPPAVHPTPHLTVRSIALSLVPPIRMGTRSPLKGLGVTGLSDPATGSPLHA